MKTFLTSGVLALALLSFSAFSQTVVAPASSGNQNADQTIGGMTSGGEAVSGLSNSVYSRELVFCDNFNIANTTTIPGWTEQLGNWQISDNMLKTPGNQAWEYITVDGSSQADGCITGRAIYGSPSETKFIALVGRYTSATTNILFKIQDNGGTGYWNSYWIYVNRDQLVTASADQNFGTDAIIQMEYTGAIVTVRIDIDRNGTWDYTNTVTVSNTGAGLCGIGAFANAYADDFCCGSYCGETPPNVPLSNVALYMALLLIAGFIAFRAYRMT